MTTCPGCHLEVPEGNFCAVCGAKLGPSPGPGGRWLRARTFGANPAEGVLRPTLASSLFPHLPQRSRRPFRLGLGLMAVALIGCAAARIPAAVIGVAALGMPILFVLYLSTARVSRDLPRRAATLAAVVAVALGAGWAWLVGQVVAIDYAGALAVPVAEHDSARPDVWAAVAGAALMAVPAAAARLLPATRREALDGFVIGALGALAFAAAATLTRLAPQLATGLVADSRPVWSLAVEAAVCGVAIPLTAAVAGGVAGLALWFTPRAGQAARARGVLVLLAVIVLALHAGTGLINASVVPQTIMLGLHLSLAVLAIVVLRLAIQVALMHEVPDPVSLEPLLCEHCEHVVPDGAFCPACGVATRASSQASRRFRRRARPVPLGVGGAE